MVYRVQYQHRDYIIVEEERHHRGYNLYRKCSICKKKIYVGRAYKHYYKDGRVEELYCSEECYTQHFLNEENRFVQKHGMTHYEAMRQRKEANLQQKICDIAKKHDEDLKDDPERIDIGKFIRVHIPCLHDKKKKEDEVS